MRSGDLLIVDFGFPRGSEAGLIRPAVVVTADMLLGERPRTVNIVPLTSNLDRRRATEVPIEDDSLGQPSVAQCHLCTAIARETIVEETGNNIGPVALRQIRTVLADILDIDS